MRPEPAVHALLRIGHPRALASGGALPAWAEAALEQAPWVVVRRARSRDGLLAVGVRGRGRAERFAAWLDPVAVRECLTPAQLAERCGWRNSVRRARIPALAALEAVAALMRRHGLTWGPCGSVGFELASGRVAASAESDLDLMIEVRTRLPRAAAAAVHAGLAQLPVRADVQLEGPVGAVALGEYALAGAPLILRTLDGPRLVEDAWSGAAAAA
jgi:phosphoribosyl-dephospho-CoA transferase